MDSILNFFDIGFADGSFSDCNGQHDWAIAEKIVGRQQKMKKYEKNFGRRNLIEDWVEMKNRGLKISGILARWTY